MANLIAMIELANLSLAILPLPHLHVPQETHDVGGRAEAIVQQQRSVGPKRPCNRGGRVATTLQLLLGSEMVPGLGAELTLSCEWAVTLEVSSCPLQGFPIKWVLEEL